MLRSLGLTDEQLEGAEKNEPLSLLAGRTARHAMQTLGTDWGRRCIDPDLWVSQWAGQVRDLLARGHKVVVDDIRFPNEAEAVKSLGGIVIRIDRPSQPPPQRWPLTHEAECHYSEIKPDFIIAQDDVNAVYQALEDILCPPAS